MTKIFNVLVASLLLFSTSILCQSKIELKNLEKQILDEILDKTKYDNRIAPTPVNGGVEPTIVNINIYFRKIMFVCAEEQEWKVQLTLRHQWNDSRLQYDDKNGKIKYITLEDPGRIWTPDTFISNALSTEIHSDLKPNVMVRIFPNGSVLFSTRLTTTMSCPMDLKHYPFDSQKCAIQLASYGYTTDDIALVWKLSDPIQVARTLNIPKFTLKSYDANYCTSRTNTGEYSCLRADFLFKREASSYICEWLLPTAILTFISFVSFWLKPKKSTRIKFLLLISILLYLHIIYINGKASISVSYTTAKDCWLDVCLIFVFGAFVEYGIVAIVDKYNKQRNDELKRKGMGKTGDPEADAVARKPLVEEEKDEKNNKQYTVSEVSTHQNLIQKWRKASISSRIDVLSSILFPLLFILYIIVFISMERKNE